MVLRGFYHANDDVIFRMRLPGTTAMHHANAWRAIDAKVSQLTSRVPALARAKDAASAWFRS